MVCAAVAQYRVHLKWNQCGGFKTLRHFAKILSVQIQQSNSVSRGSLRSIIANMHINAKASDVHYLPTYLSIGCYAVSISAVRGHDFDVATYTSSFLSSFSPDAYLCRILSPTASLQYDFTPFFDFLVFEHSTAAFIDELTAWCWDLQLFSILFHTVVPTLRQLSDILHVPPCTNFH